MKSASMSPVGALGLALALFAAIAGAVVAAEYDPEAARLEATGLSAKATIVSIPGDATDAGVEIELHRAGRPRAVLSINKPRVDDLTPGDVIDVIHDDAEPVIARIRDDVPDAPRGSRAFAVPGVLLGMAALAVIADPAALYGFLVGEDAGRPDE